MKMKLPNFLIVGAAKCGTTSLHNYLNQHSNIFMPSFDVNGIKVKEPRFLIKDLVKERLHTGVWHYNSYKDLFSKAKDELSIGEASVLYLYFYQHAIKNIKHYLGDNVKIIIMLRNPTERAYSAYQHVSRGLKEKNSFEEALLIEDDRMANDSTITPMVMYRDMGMYYKMVKAYLDAFKNVHIILYDDFSTNTNTEMDKVYQFLGVENTTKIIDIKKHNVGGTRWRNEILKRFFLGNNFVKSLIKVILPRNLSKLIYLIFSNLSKTKVNPIAEETRIKLNNHFKNDITKLSKLINKDLTHWSR